MCINKEYSLSALIISWSIGIYLIYRNNGVDRWNAIFLITFATMQLFDFILWMLHNSNNFNGLANLIISKYFIPILLSLELISVYIGSQYYNNGNTFNNLGKKIINDLYNPNTYYPKILIVASIIMCLINIKYSDKTVIGKEGNLIWGNSPNQDGIWKYITGIIFIFLLIYPYIKYAGTQPIVIIIIIYLILTLSYSFIRGSGWGSYWCWIANFLAIIMLLNF